MAGSVFVFATAWCKADRFKFGSAPYLSTADPGPRRKPGVLTAPLLSAAEPGSAFVVGYLREAIKTLNAMVWDLVFRKLPEAIGDK